MKNITLTIDEAILDQARIVAAKRKTSVNAMVREYLTNLVAEQDRSEESRKRLLQLIEESEADMGPDYKWNREELYDR